MEGIWQDLRQGLRQLSRDGGFTIAALLTFTLGIGAVAIMFTVVQAVLFRQMPYRNPGELVILGQVPKGPAGVGRIGSVSIADFADMRQRSKGFSEMSIFGSLAFNLERGERSQRLSGELVNESYLRVLGLKPALGRFFTPDEDKNPMERYVVVLGHDLWQSAYGGDPTIVGKTVHINGRLFQVVGIGPRGFRGLTDTADLFIPSMVPPAPPFLMSRALRWANGVARLAPGVTLPQAQEQQDGIAAGMAAESPATNGEIGTAVQSLSDFWFGRLRRTLWFLTAGAGILLLVACINVASLSLARAVARQGALGVRVALGAGRRRLARLLLTESLLLAVGGALLGCLLANWGAPALLSAAGIEMPSFVHVGVDPKVVLATVGLAVLSGLGFGLAPLSVLLRTDLAGGLAREGRQQPKRGSGRFLDAVIVAQVALVLLLAVAAGLLAKGFQRMLGEDLGFKSAGILTLRLDPRGPSYADEPTVTRLLGQEYLRRLSALPGVDKVALANPALPADGQSGGAVTLEDHEAAADEGMYGVRWRSVTPDYFALLGIPMVRGRAFDLRDTDTNAVIISRSMADEQWPGKDPLGRRLKLGPRGDAMLPWLTVVGVAADVRHEGYRSEGGTTPDIYLSLLQLVRRPPLTINILARPKPGVSISDLTAALHRELVAINPELPDFDAATLDARLSRQAGRMRFQVLLIGLFTAVALILSAVGIYGVVARRIAERRRELAVRVALGADRGSLLLRVVGRGARLAAIGLAVGLLAVFAIGKLLAGFLYKTSPTDPLVLGGVSLLLFAVALVANYVPARRATADDPLLGLRLR